MREVTLGELRQEGALVFGDGYRTKRSEHGRPGFRILRVADVEDGRILLDGDDFVRAEYEGAIGQKLSQTGDVLLTTKGTVGRVAIYPSVREQVVYSPQLCYFRVIDSDVIAPRYLAYWFKSATFKHQAAHRANNTDMAAYINLRDVQSLTLSLPVVAHQRAIAEVLGALDDKIAANDRVVRTLQDIADARFMGAIRGVDLGDATFGDVAQIGGGGTPKTSVEEFWGEGIAWSTPTDVTGLAAPYLRQTGRTITDAGLAACSSALYPVGSILMTSRATIGAFAIAQVPVAVNQGFIVVNAKDPDMQWWLFHEMRARVSEFLSYANGATFLELPRGRFRGLPVRLAVRDVVRQFGAVVGSLHDLAAGLSRESVTLAKTRDELLPLLMSGKLRVKDAERVVSDAV